MSVFKDSKLDVLSVLVTVIAASIPFMMAFGCSYWLAIPFVVIANLHLNGPMHYHIHRKMFSSDRLNRAYELLSTSVALVGYQEYKMIHIEHHKYVNDKQLDGTVNDPVSTPRSRRTSRTSWPTDLSKILRAYTKKQNSQDF